MNSDYLLGVDIGTSGCKSVLLESTGEIKGTCSEGYETKHPQRGWAEQEPMDWYDAFLASVRKVISRTGIDEECVASIGIDGMMNSLTLVDENGRDLRSSIIWMDRRSVPQAKKLKENREVLKYIDNPITPIALLPKILWIMENEEEVWNETKHVLLPKDFIRSKLVETEPVTDYSDASSTLLLDMQKLSWSNEICELTGIERNKLPEIVSSSKITGRLSQKAARELGLKKGVPVVTGCSDSAADNLTAGVFRPGQVLLRMGTSGALYLVTNKDKSKKQEKVYKIKHFKPESTLIHLHSPSGISKSWFQGTFLSEIVKNGDSKEGLNELCESIAKEAPVGSQGLIFYPFLGGEHSPRCDYDLRGAFLGLDMSHEISHFARAVFEGTAFSLRECFELLKRKNSSIESIRMIGGGAKSDLWRKTISNVFGKKIEVPKHDEASVGAAILAGIGSGVFESVEKAVKKCIEIKKIETPEPKKQKEYDKIYRKYLRSLDKLQKIGN